MIPNGMSSLEWPEEIVSQIDDPKLKGSIIEARADFEEDWTTFKEVLDTYPNVFER